MTVLRLENKVIGKGHRPFIIAEIAQAHDGSYGHALKFIEAAAAAGADAVKFQTHIAAAESTLDEPFRVPIKGYETRYEYWQKMEFSKGQWKEMAALAREKGLVFLSSPFSVEAVELLNDPEINVPVWKVGSGEFRTETLLNAIIKTGKPILLSSGMSSMKDIDDAVRLFELHGIAYGLFQCTSAYPAPLDKVGLNVMDDLMKAYDCPVGLSDHTANEHAPMAAIARGADMVEIHLAFHHGAFGPDTKASLTPEALKRLCDFRDDFYTMISNPVHKDSMADEMGHMRNLFFKSLALKEDLPAGTVLAESMLCEKKPAGGIPWAERQKVIGKRLVHNVPSNRLLKQDDLEDTLENT